MDVARVTLLVLTRGRMANLRQCVNSAIATVGMPMHVVVAFDDDYLGYTHMPKWPNVLKGLLAPRHYYVRGMNQLLNLAKARFDDLDYIVVSNDDVEWLDYGWGPAAVKVLEQWEDSMGVVEFVGPQQCAHYMTRVKLIDECFDGVLANPMYTMYCSDTEMFNQLKDMNRFTHAAPADGPKAVRHLVANDDLRTEVRWWAHIDRAIYNKRAKKFGWDEMP